MLAFERLAPDDGDGILVMSRLATDILREHYDPILGKAQNDYMLEKFQSVEAINHQLASGYQYYFVRADGARLRFDISRRPGVSSGKCAVSSQPVPGTITASTRGLLRCALTGCVRQLRQSQRLRKPWLQKGACRKERHRQRLFHG